MLKRMSLIAPLNQLQNYFCQPKVSFERVFEKCGQSLQCLVFVNQESPSYIMRDEAFAIQDCLGDQFDLSFSVKYSLRKCISSAQTCRLAYASRAILETRLTGHFEDYFERLIITAAEHRSTSK